MLCEDADAEQARLLQAGLNAGVRLPKASCHLRQRRRCASAVDTG